MRKMRTWHEYLIEQFADREKAMGYLQVAWKNTKLTIIATFMGALQTVVEAQGPTNLPVIHTGIENAIKRQHTNARYARNH